MKVEKSELELEDFFVVGFNWACVPLKNHEDNLPDLSIDLIDIEFDIFNSSTNENQFKIVMVVSTIDELNEDDDKNRSGYHFTILAESHFKITNDGLTEENINNIVSFSALPMIINSIRMFIMNHSSFCPFGQWVFPSINLNDLLKKKAAIEINDN